MSASLAAVHLRVLHRRLARPIRTAHGLLRRRDGLLVVVEDTEGVVGLGEAAPLRSFDGGSPAAVRAALEAARAAAPGRPPGSLLAAVPALVGDGVACARFALDAALADLAARRAGLPLAVFLAAAPGAAGEDAAEGLGTARERDARASGLLGGAGPRSSRERLGGPEGPRPSRERSARAEGPARCGAPAPSPVRARVEVHALLAAEDPAPAAEAARRAVAAGFRALKLKGGSAEPSRDVARVAAVRAAVGPEVGIRLDANGAWSEAQAYAAAEALAPLGLGWLEQPVPAANVEALARLRRQGAVRVAADEALLRPEGGRRVLGEGAADVLVLKPAALGGLDRALALAREAARAGVATTVTTLLDGAVAERAALHLAAALPDRLEACGVGTAPRLHGDVAPALRPLAGSLAVPSGPGLGLELGAPPAADARGATAREGSAPG